MKKRYRVLLVGLIVSISLFCYAWFNEQESFNEWKKVEAKCKSEQPFKPAYDKSLGLTKEEMATLDKYRDQSEPDEECLGAWLSVDDFVLNDVQNEVLKSYKKYELNSAQSTVIACIGTGILFLSLLPIAWYFLLARIVELSEAITRKR